MKRVEIPLRGRGSRIVVTESDIPYDDNHSYVEIALKDRRGRMQQRMVLTPEAAGALKSALTAIDIHDVVVKHA